MWHSARLQNLEAKDEATLDVKMDEMNYDRVLSAQAGQTVPLTLRVTPEKSSTSKVVRIYRIYHQLTVDDYQIVDLEAHMIHVNGEPFSVPVQGASYEREAYIELELRGAKADVI